MSQSFDVLVVGGGIVGLTAALAMAQRHYTVAVIDAGSLTTDTTKTDPRVYAINKASQHLLTQLDVWAYLDKSRIAPYRHMHVWDGVSKAYIDFDSRSVAQQHLGSIIEESVLKEALLKKIATEENVSLFAHSTVDEVAVLEHQVNIASQTNLWDGKLLIVADGANSPVRQKLQVALTTWSYHQHALVATVKTEKPHQNTAYQVFNPDGPLAFLPLPDPHHCSIVWSLDTPRSKQLMALDERAFNKELTHAFAQELGETELLGLRYQFPLQMRHVKQYSGLRWLLVGDAAHTIHPLAGLGLNIGLADVSSWLKQMDQYPQGLTSSRKMAAYQRERKHAVWQVIMLMEGFKRLFSYSHPAITYLRGGGLRLCNTVTLLKKLFIEHAEG